MMRSIDSISGTLAITHVKFRRGTEHVVDCLQVLEKYVSNGGCGRSSCSCKACSFLFAGAVLGEWDAIVLISSYDFMHLQKTIFGCFRLLGGGETLIYDTYSELSVPLGGLCDNLVGQESFETGPMSRKDAHDLAEKLRAAGIACEMVQNEKEADDGAELLEPATISFIVKVVIQAAWLNRKEIFSLVREYLPFSVPDHIKDPAEIPLFAIRKAFESGKLDITREEPKRAKKEPPTL